MRTATVERKTRETEIAVSLDLDGTGVCDIDTGIGFLDSACWKASAAIP